MANSGANNPLRVCKRESMTETSYTRRSTGNERWNRRKETNQKTSNTRKA